MMPGIAGDDVHAAVTAARPEMAARFIFVTGGVFTQRGQQFLAGLSTPVLSKPIDFEELRRVVRATLSRTPK
jgi:response regulator RpfG family c-di-GMP phosphodiesterase